jgi:hypothetical protein
MCCFLSHSIIHERVLWDSVTTHLDGIGQLRPFPKNAEELDLEQPKIADEAICPVDVVRK